MYTRVAWTLPERCFKVAQGRLVCLATSPLHSASRCRSTQTQCCAVKRRRRHRQDRQLQQQMWLRASTCNTAAIVWDLQHSIPTISHFRSGSDGACCAVLCCATTAVILSTLLAPPFNHSLPALSHQPPPLPQQPPPLHQQAKSWTSRLCLWTSPAAVWRSA